MGLVLLDMQFQVERAFRIRMPKGWWERLGIRGAEDDATLEQLLGLIGELCGEQGAKMPADGWERLAEIARAVSALDEVGPATTLREVAPDG